MIFLFMNKRGQGLPITTIIIAILAMVVLAVIVLIFYGKIRVFGGEMISCTGKGGFCASASCASGYQTELKDTDCPTGQKCCLSILPADAGAPCKDKSHCKASLDCIGNKCDVVQKKDK